MLNFLVRFNLETVALSDWLISKPILKLFSKLFSSSAFPNLIQDSFFINSHNMCFLKHGEIIQTSVENNENLSQKSYSFFGLILSLGLFISIFYELYISKTQFVTAQASDAHKYQSWTWKKFWVSCNMLFYANLAQLNLSINSNECYRSISSKALLNLTRCRNI